MSKTDYIKVIIKEPNKNPKVKKIANSLESIRVVLKGNFELVEYDKQSYIAHNYRSTSKCQVQIGNHIFNGTLLIIGNDNERGDFTTLREEQVKEYQKEFSNKDTKVIERNELEL